MKAITYHGFKNVKVDNVKDPTIQKPDDIIVKVTSTAICGSDLHLIHGMIHLLKQSEKVEQCPWWAFMELNITCSP